MAWAAPPSAPGGPPPNVIFIITDDQGISDVDFEPHAAPIHMPHLDRLAARGVTFPNAWHRRPA